MFTIFFTIVPLIMLSLGLYIDMNSKSSKPDLVCFNDIEWVPTTVLGTVFLFSISITTILQINCSQFILIRVPLRHGVFDQTTLDKLKVGLLRRLKRTASEHTKTHQHFKR